MSRIRIEKWTEDEFDRLLDEQYSARRVSKPKVHCRKRRYATEIDAQRAITHARWRLATEDDPYIPVRFYPCDRCGGFHLTSKPARGGQLIDMELYRSLRSSESPDDPDDDPPGGASAMLNILSQCVEVRSEAA